MFTDTNKEDKKVSKFYDGYTPIEVYKRFHAGERGFAYTFLAGDNAVPYHELDGPIRLRRRLGHEALEKKQNHQS